MRRPAIMALLSLALGVTACAYYDDLGSSHARAAATERGGRS